jgi:hypothetical protein
MIAILSCLAALFLLITGEATAASEAGVVLEYHLVPSGFMEMLAARESSLLTEARDGRCRVESRSVLPDGKTSSVIHIIDSAKGLDWEIHPEDGFYYEMPWPDTTTRLRVLKRVHELEAQMPETPMGSMGDMLKGASIKLVHTGARDTLRGLAAEQILVHVTSKPPAPGRATYVMPNFTYEVWTAKEFPDADEAQRLLRDAASLQERSGSTADLAPWEGERTNLPELLDTLQGVPVRILIRLDIPDSLLKAEGGPQGGTASPDEEGNDIDPKTGAMILMNMELTTLRVGPVSDDRFELPPGLEKRDRPPSIWELDKPLPPRKTPRRTPRHSPR